MLASICYGLAHVVTIVLNMVMLLMIISFGLSWFSADPRNPYVQMVRALTEPMYRPFRRFTRNIPGPLDLAPTIAMLILIFLQKALPAYLMSLSFSLR